METKTTEQQDVYTQDEGEPPQRIRQILRTLKTEDHLPVTESTA
jgi:hypothetical protein